MLFRRSSPTILFLWLCIASSERVADGGERVADGAASCPCVPDEITFQFDFSWGCNHPPSSSDFASSSFCSITGSPLNSSIRKVIIQDRVAKEEVELEVFENDRSKTGLSAQKTYSFVYRRFSVRNSPTVLWLDFHTTSSASRSPVASIDLYYSPNSIDCVDRYNPIYWAGDWVYFLTVLSLEETRDPRCGSRAADV